MTPDGRRSRPPLRRPRPLRPGDAIALVAPSRPSRPDLLDAARRYLEAKGFCVRRGRHVHDRYHYLGGRDGDRAADVMDAFLDDDVAALVCVRGGFGAGRILDRLDYGAIASRPKAVVGFSDTTGLHLALYARSGLVGFTGALADTDLSRAPPDPLLAQTLWRLLSGADPLGPLPPADAAYGVLRPGRAEGPLVPANLSLLCSLLGTPYVPDLTGAILLLEDVSEAPYRVDRMLTQLRLAGILDRIAALALGSFCDCFTPGEMESSPTLDEIVADAIGGRALPVLAGVPFGHTPRRAVLPLGVLARVDTEIPEIRLLEGAVERP